jgi:hypothetical protein
MPQRIPLLKQGTVQPDRFMRESVSRRLRDELAVGTEIYVA